MIFFNRPDESTTKKSTDCGPEEVKERGISEWTQDQKKASDSAKVRAKQNAMSSCEGDCPPNKQCVYFQKSLSSELKDDRTVDNQLEYRYIATSKGTCVCE